MFQTTLILLLALNLTRQLIALAVGAHAAKWLLRILPSISDTSAVTIHLTGAAPSVNATLCLNDKSSTADCENLTAFSTAYVTNYNNNTVSLCPVSTDGSSFGNCTTNNDISFNEPTAIALNPAKPLAYIANYGDGTPPYTLSTLYCWFCINMATLIVTLIFKKTDVTVLKACKKLF